MCPTFFEWIETTCSPRLFSGSAILMIVKVITFHPRGKPSLVPKQAIFAWLCKKICYCLNFKYVLKVKRAYVQIIAGSLSTSQKASQVSWIFAIFKSYALQMIVLAEFVKIDVHEIFVWYAKINVPKKQFFYIPQKINKQKISQISRCFVWERNWLLLKLCEILVLIPFNAVSFQTHSVKIYLLVMNTSTWQRSFLEDFFIQCLI